MDRSQLKQVDPLTPKEVAALERCNPETVYRALQAGELEGYKIGRDWRVTQEALERYRRRMTEEGNGK